MAVHVARAWRCTSRRECVWACVCVRARVQAHGFPNLLRGLGSNAASVTVNTLTAQVLFSKYYCTKRGSGSLEKRLVRSWLRESTRWAWNSVCQKGSKCSKNDGACQKNTGVTLKRFLLAKSETIWAFKINPESNGLYNTLLRQNSTCPHGYKRGEGTAPSYGRMPANERQGMMALENRHLATVSVTNDPNN